MLQSIGYRRAKIAKGFVGWCDFLDAVYDMSSHESLRLRDYFGKYTATLHRPAETRGTVFKSNKTN
jgi:hypothetical protein